MNHLPLATRRSFLRTLGTAAAAAPFVTSNLFAQPPSRRLRHASFGVGGQGKSDLTQLSNCQNVEIVAICDVDLDRMKEARERFPNARVYQDWRELLDREAKNIDSVNVSTPDHMHAPIAISAMQLGKHVYGQKPLAHDIYEVRHMTEMADQSKLVTQMGIQRHSSAHLRMTVQLLQSGVIGKVKEVHCWCEKLWGASGPSPDKQDRVPENFAWNLWLGVCAERPFVAGGYYHPGNWRKRLDFGTGTLGDMGCHILDAPLEALGIKAPVSIRSEGPAPDRWNWPVNNQILYTFPGTAQTAGPLVPVTWYDGACRPPAHIVALIESEPYPKAEGCIYVGTDGVLLQLHESPPVLFPAGKFKDYKLPKVAGAKHHEQFVNACRGEGKTTAPFSYGGPLTETVLLGCIASRYPKTTLKWDSGTMKFDLTEANQYVRREYRNGWSVRGLS